MAVTLTFDATILKFIALIQSALAIFGMFDLEHHRNGLLCDTTVESVQRWTLEVGEKLKGLDLQVCYLP